MIYLSQSTSEIRVRLAPSNMFYPSSTFSLMVPRRCFFRGFFLLFVFHVCRACSHLLRKGLPLGSFVCDVFLRFFTFLYGVLGQVWYLILSI